MFTIKYFDYVNKDKFTVAYEKTVFDFIRSLEQLQACYHALYKNIKVVDSFVSNLSNSNPEVVAIKRSHNVAKNNVLNDFKNYYVISSDIVSSLESEFEQMSSINVMKSELFKKYALKMNSDSDFKMPIEIFHKIVENEKYKLLVGHLLNNYQNFDKLINTRKAKFKSIQYWLNNLLKLEKTIVVNAERNPEMNDLMSNVGSQQLLGYIKSQLDYFQALINEAEEINDNIENKMLTSVQAMQSKYRMNNRIDPNFYNNYIGGSSWKELLSQYNKTARAIDHEIANLSEELDSIKNREKTNYNKTVFIYNNPKVVALASEKAALLDLMSNQRLRTDVILTEIEECMTKNGEELKQCVRSLEAVRDRDSNKVEDHIKFIRRHEKYGQMYADLVLALRKEKEEIEREITKSELNKYMQQHQQKIHLANQKRLQAEAEARGYEDEMKQVQMMQNENLKDSPNQLKKNQLSQQAMYSDLVGRSVAMNDMQRRNFRGLVEPAQELETVKLYKQYENEWDSMLPSGTLENRNIGEFLKDNDFISKGLGQEIPFEQLNAELEVKQSGGGFGSLISDDNMSLILSTIGSRFADGKFTRDLKVLKTFLHEKRKKEIAKMSPYERSEMKMLVVDMNIAKYYELQVLKMIGGLYGVQSFNDVLRRKNDQINYSYIVQNFEYHKSKVYYLLNSMTAYARQQMERIRRYYDDTKKVFLTAEQTFKNDTDVVVKINALQNSDEVTGWIKNDNVLMDHLLPFRGQNAVKEKIKNVTGVTDDNIENVVQLVSFPHAITLVTDEYNMLFNKMKDIVVKNDRSDNNRFDDYHLSMSQYNQYKEMIGKLDELFYRHQVLMHGGAEAEDVVLGSKIPAVVTTYQYTNDKGIEDEKKGGLGNTVAYMVGANFQKGLIKRLDEVVGKLNLVHCRLVEIITDHELNKTKGKEIEYRDKFTDAQLLFIRNLLEGYAKGLGDYYKMYIDKCMKIELSTLGVKHNKNSIRMLEEEAVNINEKIDAVEKQVNSIDVIGKLRSIDNNIKQLYQGNFEQDHNYGYEMNKKILQIRKLQMEKTNMLDYLANVCGDYDDRIASLIKCRQHVFNCRDAWYDALYKQNADGVIGRSIAKEYIDFMMHKFSAYHEYFKGSGYEDKKVLPIKKIIYQVYQTTAEVMKLCGDCDKDSVSPLRDLVGENSEDYKNYLGKSNFTLSNLGYRFVANQYLTNENSVENHKDREELMKAVSMYNSVGLKGAETVIYTLNTLKDRMEQTSRYINMYNERGTVEYKNRIKGYMHDILNIEPTPSTAYNAMLEMSGKKGDLFASKEALRGVQKVSGVFSTTFIEENVKNTLSRAYQLYKVKDNDLRKKINKIDNNKQTKKISDELEKMDKMIQNKINIARINAKTEAEKLKSILELSDFNDKFGYVYKNENKIENASVYVEALVNALDVLNLSTLKE